MEKRKLHLPLGKDEIQTLKAGDSVLLSGTIYTARDAAHKRLIESIKKDEELPIKIEGSVIYYMGPSPTPPGEVIGAAGPTTSHRMDRYTPELLDMGLSAMIGKGNRTPPVIESIKKNNAVYFVAVGGAGALLQNHIVENKPVAYDDLGTEAIRELTITDFPVIVAIDSRGNNLYETAFLDYKK